MSDNLRELLATLPPDDLPDVPDRFNRVRRRAVRRQVTLAALSAVTVAAVLAAAGVGAATLAGRGSSPAPLQPGLQRCGPTPVSNGLDRDRVKVRLELPSHAVSGQALAGRVVASADTAVRFGSGLPVEVLLLRRGVVVGGGFYGSAVRGVGQEPAITPGHPFTAPVQVVVRGCRAGEDNIAPTDRPLLPAGTYQAVAVLEDHPFNHVDPVGRHIVSDPTTVEVTVAPRAGTAASCYPSPLHVSAPRVPAGGTVTVWSEPFACAARYPAGKTYTLLLGQAGRAAPVELGVAQVNRDGSFAADVRIPAAASPGQAFIVARGSAYDAPCQDTGSAAASCASYAVAFTVLPPGSGNARNAAVTTCRAGTIAFGANGGYNPHNGVIVWTLTLTNTGPATCTLRGYPSLREAHYSTNARVPLLLSDGTTSPWFRAIPETTVTLEPGRVASFVAVYDNETKSADGDCALGETRLFAFLPGSTKPILQAAPNGDAHSGFQACPSHTVWVSPIRSGTPPPPPPPTT